MVASPNLGKPKPKVIDPIVLECVTLFFLNNNQLKINSNTLKFVQNTEIGQEAQNGQILALD